MLVFLQTLKIEDTVFLSIVCSETFLGKLIPTDCYSEEFSFLKTNTLLPIKSICI